MTHGKRTSKTAAPAKKYAEIGRRIRKVRQQSGLSITSAAPLFHLSPQSLSRYERWTREPDLEFLTSFMAHFRVNPSWLFWGLPPMILDGKTTPGRDDQLSLLMELFNSLQTSRPEIPGPAGTPSGAEATEDNPVNYLRLLAAMKFDTDFRRRVFTHFVYYDAKRSSVMDYYLDRMYKDIE